MTTKAIVGPAKRVNDSECLKRMAPVWVGCWLAHGGYLIVDANRGTVSTGMGMSGEFGALPGTLSPA